MQVIPKKIVNELGNTNKIGVVTKFSYLNVIAFLLAVEAMKIDNENCLFICLTD